MNHIISIYTCAFNICMAVNGSITVCSDVSCEPCVDQSCVVLQACLRMVQWLASVSISIQAVACHWEAHPV